MSEMTQILGIQTWRVPLPADRSQQWTLDLDDWHAIDTPRRSVYEALKFEDTALIVLRPSDGDNYRFDLLQNDGQSTGDIELVPEGAAGECGQVDISWERVPVCRNACRSFVVAEVRCTGGRGAGRQVVLSLVPQLSVPDGSAVPLP